MNATKLAGLAPYYSARGITLYHSQYQTVLPLLAPGSIDALITDPPYATTNIAWDKPIDWPAFWPAAMRICKPLAPMVLFASGKFVYELQASNTKHFRYDLIWEKNLPVGHLDANRRPLRSHENILVFTQHFRGSTYNPQKTVGKVHTIGKGKDTVHYGKTSGKVTKRSTNLWHPRSILRYNNSRTGPSLHPTQKPLDLMKWLVLSYSNRFDIVLDPFAGSGSTLAAATHHGRKAIGIEQDEQYCEITAKRLEAGE